MDDDGQPGARRHARQPLRARQLGGDRLLVPDGEITRRVFQGQWVRTGDTYVRSADGYYTSLGRTDDIIKAGGIWVSPTEVEERLRAHPAVAQVVVVVGARRRRAGQAGGLRRARPRRRRRPPTTSWPSAATGLAAFKRPRHVAGVRRAAQTATGKLQRFRIRELAIERLGGTAAVPTPATAADDA